jgi:rubrerythrin
VRGVEAVAQALRRLAEAERKYAEELRGLAESVKYATVIGAVIEAIASDSEKHAGLYEAMLKIVVGWHQPGLVREDLKLVAQVIDRHIETERRMIEETRKLLEEVADPRMRLLLAAIYEDEVKHHRVLTDIKDKIAKAETLSEEEFWEAVWRDSPWHGTPGG